MTKIREGRQAVEANVARWVVGVLGYSAGVLSLTIGFVLCVGGLERFSGPSFESIRQVPGSPYSWGVIAVVAGLVVAGGSLFGFPRVIAAGAALAGMWSILFAAAFFKTALERPDASLTAPLVYGFLAFVYALISGAHWAMRR